MFALNPAGSPAFADQPSERKFMHNEIQKSSYGTLPDGRQVDLYTLKNTHGMVCKISTYGGIITELDVPDRHGKFGDVVLGFDSLQGYAGKHPFFGALVGRVANRIAKGQFTLDGQAYQPRDQQWAKPFAWAAFTASTKLFGRRGLSHGRTVFPCV